MKISSSFFFFGSPTRGASTPTVDGTQLEAEGQSTFLTVVLVAENAQALLLFVARLILLALLLFLLALSFALHFNGRRKPERHLLENEFVRGATNQTQLEYHLSPSIRQEIAGATPTDRRIFASTAGLLLSPSLEGSLHAAERVRVPCQKEP
jgi:hypothetical protein